MKYVCLILLLACGHLYADATPSPTVTATPTPVPVPTMTPTPAPVENFENDRPGARPHGKHHHNGKHPWVG